MTSPVTTSGEIEEAVAVVPREEFLRMAEEIRAMKTSELIAMFDHGDMAAFCAKQPSYKKRGPLAPGAYPLPLPEEDNKYNMGLFGGALLLLEEEIDHRIPVPGYIDRLNRSMSNALPWDDRATKGQS